MWVRVVLLLVVGIATIFLAEHQPAFASHGPTGDHCNDPAGPGVDWSGCDKSGEDLSLTNLSGANLSGADLSNTWFVFSDVSGADFSGAKLSYASFNRATLGCPSNCPDFSGANLEEVFIANFDLRGVDLSNANLRNADLSDTNLSGADLSNAFIIGTDLSNANLSGANLSYSRIFLTTILTGVNFGCPTNCADMSGGRFNRSDFSGFNLSGVNLSGADISDSDFVGTNLSDANLSNVNTSAFGFFRVDFSNANLSGANLSGARVGGSDFSNANLSGANLSGVNLGSATLTGVNFGCPSNCADLSGVSLGSFFGPPLDLSGVNFSGVNLSGAGIGGVDFSGANLSGANLSGAYITFSDFTNANLSGANLSGVTYIGANLSGANLSGADLRNGDFFGNDPGVDFGCPSNCADFSGANLSGANLRDFPGINLSGANFSGANLSGANLFEANLSGANFSGANLSNVGLSRANLSGANFSSANLSNFSLSGFFGGLILGCPSNCPDFSDADLSNARFNRINLSGVNLSDANLSNARFGDVNLSGANLSGTNLSGGSFFGDFGCPSNCADFSGANLAGVQFFNADLSGANLSGLDLSNAQFFGVNFSGANLSGANISNTRLDFSNLTNANLSGANLSGASLASADLSGTNVTGVDLTNILDLHCFNNPICIPDDGDPFHSNFDCDDMDPNVYPGAPEILDGKDSNCDGIIPVDEIDDDNDGIRNTVDTKPNTFSDIFSDDATTSGDITERGDQDISIFDEPNPDEGVFFKAADTGGATEAKIIACTKAGQIKIDSGDSGTITCGSITVSITSGSVDVQFNTPGGPATTTMGPTDSITFNDDTLTFTNNSPTSDAVIIIGGEVITLSAGETLTVSFPVSKDSFSYQDPNLGDVRHGQGHDKGFCMNQNCIDVDGFFNHFPETTVPQGSTQTFSLLINCPRGVDTCNHATIEGVLPDSDFYEEQWGVTLDRQVRSDEWDMTINNPFGEIGEVTTTVQEVDQTFLSVTYNIEFLIPGSIGTADGIGDPHENNRHLHVTVWDNNRGISNYIFNEGVYVDDIYAYPKVDTSYEKPIQLESLCLDDNTSKRYTCAFDKVREWTIKNAEKALLEIEGKTELDVLNEEFLSKFKELKQAIADDDSEKIFDLREQLDEIKTKIYSLKN